LLATQCQQPKSGSNSAACGGIERVEIRSMAFSFIAGGAIVPSK
jgi:hypothetical protein